MKISPYDNVPVSGWLKITEKLIEEFPLSTDELVEVVLASWNSIFDSSFGTKGFRIGVDIFPKPQIMGFLLHELIPLELAARYPKEWRGEKNAGDKDIVCIKNDLYSVEVKTSSNKEHIFGNRSYAQETSKDKKSKSGYYLTVNFEKFSEKKARAKVLKICFGRIDSDDWIGQKAATGQQSRLPPDVEKYKLLEIYRAT